MKKEHDKQIYFVEDNEMFAIPVKIGLEKIGYQVKYFHSGEEMFSQNTVNPDIVVLDYMIGDESEPLKGGQQLIRAVIEKYGEVPVVVLSAIEDIKEIDLIMKSGATDFISKGDHFFDDLTKSIRNIEVMEELKTEILQLKKYVNYYRYCFILALGILLLILLWSG